MRKALVVLVGVALGGTAHAATMSESYCKTERDSIISQQRRLSFTASDVDSKASYLNLLSSQINTARNSSYSNVTYINGLIQSYNMQLGWYESAVRDYNYELDRLNRRIRNYNLDCT